MQLIKVIGLSEMKKVPIHSTIYIIKTLLIIQLVVIFSLVVTSISPITTDLSLQNPHQHYKPYHHLSRPLVNNVASNRVAPRFESRNVPERIEHLQRPPIIVRQQLVPVITTSQPIIPKTLLTYSPSTPTSSTTSIPAKQRNGLISSVYRGARDTMGGVVNMTSSIPLGNMASAILLFGGVFLASPLVIPEIKRSLISVSNLQEDFDIQGRLDSFVGWVERQANGLPMLPRLHPQECIKRAVCEVNHDSKRYGLPGLILQVMFPPNQQMETGISRFANKYIMAASFGRYNTTDDPQGCQNKFDECMINLAELTQNLIRRFLD